MTTVYRNLQEQVYENAKDIEELQKTSSTEATQNLITETLNDYGIINKPNNLQIDKSTIVENSFVVRPPVGTQYYNLVDIFGDTYIKGELQLIGILKIGNTEITEAQLQKLLQLIQNQ